MNSTLIFIALGAGVLICGGWYYRSLLIDSFGKKSSEREAKIHAKINEKNKEIDKKAKDKHNEIDNISDDNMLSWLQKKMKKKEKK
jgi:hypothetical protein